MKKNLLWLAGAVLASVAFTSCYYDPYYGGGGSTSVSYSSGYGDGYGYGGSSFNTSVFVSTGNARWGYDPYCYSYYDYHTRRYYDPYLYGYYPVGYRPPIVYGVPHPYGYRRGYCPPPSRVTNVYVSNYRDREYRYRNSSYGWAKQVRQQPRQHGSRPSQGSFDRQGQNQGRPNNASRPSSSYRENQMRNQQRESSRPGARQQNSRQPSRNNQLVNSREGQRGYGPNAGNQQRQQAQRQQAQRQQAQRNAQNYGNPGRQQGQRGGGGGGGGRQPQGQGEKEGKRQQGYR